MTAQLLSEHLSLSQEDYISLFFYTRDENMSKIDFQLKMK